MSFPNPVSKSSAGSKSNSLRPSVPPSSEKSKLEVVETTQNLGRHFFQEPRNHAPQELSVSRPGNPRQERWSHTQEKKVDLEQPERDSSRPSGGEEPNKSVTPIEFSARKLSPL